MTENQDRTTGGERTGLEASERAAVEAATSGAEAGYYNALFDHQQTMQKRRLGLVGIIFGSNAKEQLPANVAALVTVALLLLLAAACIWLDTQRLELVFDAGLSVLMLALGYLFGSNTRSGDGSS